MIELVSADGDYGRPAAPGWRETDWRAHERDAIVAGRRLRYIDVGSGPRCFVLIHGMGGRWQHWLETIPALAKRGRVLAIDLPGSGTLSHPRECHWTVSPTQRRIWLGNSASSAS